MSIVRADGWVAWYIEVPHNHPNVHAEIEEIVASFDKYGSPPRQRMLSVPLVVWREYANGGVMGLVTAEATWDNAHLLTPACDLVITGPEDPDAGEPRRYIFSHYARAEDVSDHRH